MFQSKRSYLVCLEIANISFRDITTAHTGAILWGKMREKRTRGDSRRAATRQPTTLHFRVDILTPATCDTCTAYMRLPPRESSAISS